MKTPDKICKTNGQNQFETIEICPDTGQVMGWCATLKALGLYSCPLKSRDGSDRDCSECWCG